LLLLARSAFLFGYAKPVPVNFGALRNPRIGMVLVAAAGPAMNIGLAIVAALSFHLIGYQRWSRFPGQNGGLAKMDSGFGYAASFSSFACVAYTSSGVLPAKAECGRSVL